MSHGYHVIPLEALILKGGKAETIITTINEEKIKTKTVKNIFKNKKLKSLKNESWDEKYISPHINSESWDVLPKFSWIKGHNWSHNVSID